MGLIKATLQQMSSVEKNKPLGKAVPVQFNPTSLRLSVSNQSESGQALGVRTRQHLAAGSTKLTMQLVFDTADEGTTEQPVSVRGKTKLVLQFLEPVKQGTKDAPPRVRFQWGDLIFDGIMDSATEDIDFFAENGTPLRAKVDVAITGQRTKDLKLQSGPGGSDPPSPDQSNNAGPGTTGAGAQPNRTDTAKGGESAAAFVQRQGLDPAAWRAIANQVDDPLSLPAGLPINFSAAASLASGLASAAGFAAGVGQSIGDAINAATTAAAGGTDSARREDARQAGFALSDAGGVGRAVETAQASRAQAAVGESVRGFAGATGAAGTAGSTGAAGTTAAAGATGAAVAAAAAGATGRAGGPGAPAGVPRGDRRQNWYGFGVPLRSRIAPAAAERAAVVFGARSVGARPRTNEPPVTDDPTVAPWQQLPRLRTSERRGSHGHASGGGCGCGGRCGCGH